MKLLRSRFSKKVNSDVQAFSSSLKFDRRLYKYDIAGSIAHAKMLEKCRIISGSDSTKIINGLKEIEKGLENGKVRLDPSADDIHMAVESRLIQKIGETGKKLHTGRSRNDQVALDMRLYARDEVREIMTLIKKIQKAVLDKAVKNIDAIMPGYTHLQHGQPILFSHHFMAYFWMFQRDIERLQDSLGRINVMPLGSGALAGTSLPIDRNYTAKILGFPGISENSIDAVSDRDFVIEMAADLNIIMIHLSRLSEELVLWSSAEFGFIEINETFCTGSSIMPQKKNPDIPELVRAKTGRVFGSLSSIITMMKGLPLSYNRDMQEDKEALFDAVDTAKDCLRISASLIEGININRKAMYRSADDGFSIATNLTDYLAGKGVPFRSAYSAVGNIVRYCIDNNTRIDKLSLKELKSFDPKFSSDIFKVFSLENSVNSRRSSGGTAADRVKEQIMSARSVLLKK